MPTNLCACKRPRKVRSGGSSCPCTVPRAFAVLSPCRTSHSVVPRWWSMGRRMNFQPVHALWANREVRYGSVRELQCAYSARSQLQLRRTRGDLSSTLLCHRSARVNQQTMGGGPQANTTPPCRAVHVSDTELPEGQRVGRTYWKLCVPHSTAPRRSRSPRQGQPPCQGEGRGFGIASSARHEVLFRTDPASAMLSAEVPCVAIRSTSAERLGHHRGTQESGQASSE